MAMAPHGGAGGAPRACAAFPDSLFQESGLELEQAKPSANSLEEIASVAVLGGGDPGEMGSPPSRSVPSPRVAIGDRKFEAGSPPRSRLSRPEPCSALLLQVVKIKEEEEEEEEVVAAAIMADPRDAAAVSPSCSWRTAAEEVARPMEGLGEAGPTPFLRKTYEMVSDPGSDRVVSWGSSRDSFVVWDQHEFSKQVLPRYFKHSNFSSFIRQLNTYGFRKIDTDQWEFANEGFQGGKKHLLKNIKRRGKLSKQRKTSRSNFTSDCLKVGKEGELETLKKDQEALKAEILKLREERENSQHEINQVTERVRSAECRHQQMFLFLSKAAKSPNFVQHLIQKKRHKRELDTRESSKESKLLGPDGEATKCLLEAMDPRIQSPNVDCPRISDDSAQMQSRPNSVLPEDFEDIQMRNPWPSPVGGGDFRVAQGQMPDQMAAASLSHLSSVFHEMSEKLLGDNVVVGDDAADVEEEEDDLAVNDTRIYLELEGLIEKPCGWSEYTSELVEQAAVLMP
ncbi:heat shock factor protein HSF30-like [Syzygium oleosum]|uniref:heat shock factor protein HSF30-like n=1 Tax=Syzygium oleosum TaxID=219896 RepID=UPI0024BB32BA|nr:heat shock factor protein HSF30-like [Syzygium oleosum]XP_056166688.1 heat shock factor protein HSF30-like [Syzygium oleosum]